MGSATALSGVLLLPIFMAGCGYRELPPPSPPVRTFPDVELPAAGPEVGKVRVVLDANGERAMVTEVSSWSSSSGWVSGVSGTLSTVTEEQRPLCVAPCVTALSPGMHVLRFKSQSNAGESDVVLQVNEHPKVVRHAMGRVEAGSSAAEVTGIALVVLGGTALLVGGLLLGQSATEEGTKAENHQQLGVAVTAGGGVSLALSVPLFLLGRGTRRPGATTEFEF